MPIVCLCIDANFRLKEQLVSSHSRDPSLNDGLGYFVKRRDYEKYVLQNPEGDEITTCVPLAALAKQNTKFSKGLRYTGVGGVCCGRSDMFVKLGNLHKGERYRNMDYIVGVAMRDFLELLRALLIYDIACQWFVHLYERVHKWPGEVRWPSHTSMEILPAIGKLHEPGHKQGGDHQQFNLNLINGAGKTDGESMERIWGEHNNLGNATKTMGPGSREDNIDAAAGGWNWEKYIAMAHEGLTANLPVELVEKWEAMCMEWEKAPYPKRDILNPYHVEEEFISEEKALQELSIEEERRVQAGGSQYHAISAPQFVVMALGILDTQDKLRQKVQDQKREGTIIQSRKLTDERNALRRRLQVFQDIQPIYMPGLLHHLEDTKQQEDTHSTQPEDVKLWLPSDLPASIINKICTPGMRAVEAKLQRARCFDSLHGVRHTLRVKSRMMLFRNTNVRGQRQSGKSREIVNRVVRRARWYTLRYRKARAAYHMLVGTGPWEKTLKPLRNEDVRSYCDPALVKIGSGRKGNDEEDKEEAVRLEQLKDYQEVIAEEERSDGDGELELPAEELDLIHPDRQQWEHRSKHGTGETRKELSWIWVSGGKIELEDGADENENEVLRSEWCKSRARARRAQEEVLLVEEEMRRTLEFLEWRAQEWESCAEVVMGWGEDEHEGSRAYALAQANVQRALKVAFHGEWKKTLVEVEESEELEEEDSADYEAVNDESADDEASDDDEELEGMPDVDEDLELGADGDESQTEEWDPETDGF
ncbi:hypothetical protein VNI00_018005 [Paramarasmius palmivorus]|uniref:Uncharacterized protein n=1 Tax=Paramarasmius palmivorus TaxID=297713 RepID=A0AAW0B4C6_9AGAR